MVWEKTVRKVFVEVLARNIIDRYLEILKDKIQLDETFLELVGALPLRSMKRRSFRGLLLLETRLK